MARTPKHPELRQAQLSNAEMQAAIPMIDRRLADLAAFDPLSIIERSDARIKALSGKRDDLLVSIFGAETVEYKRYQGSVTRLDTAPWNYAYPVPMQQVQQGKENIESSTGAATTS